MVVRRKKNNARQEQLKILIIKYCIFKSYAYVRLYIGNDPICARNGAWEFNKMFVGSYTGLNVDLSSGSVLSFSSSFEFNAFPKSDDGRTCEKGFIQYRLPNPTRDAIDDWDEGEGWVEFLDLRKAPSPYIPTPPPP